MNPLIAQLIERMANHDGTLSQAFTTTRLDHNGPEIVPGPSGNTQAHPSAGSRPQQSLGQHAVILARSGGGPRTAPTTAEAYALSPGGLTQTTGEKGHDMGINPQLIQQVMQQMMGAQGGQGAPGPVPNVPGPVSPDMVMQAIGGGGGGGGLGEIMQLLGGGGGGGGGGGLPPELMALLGGGGQNPNEMQGRPMPDAEDQGEGPESGPPDAEDRAEGPSDEQELEGVRQQMGKSSPGQLMQELKQCLDSGDHKGCEMILQEMEKDGIDIEKLPPSLLQELEKGGYLDDQGGQDDNQGDQYQR